VTTTTSTTTATIHLTPARAAGAGALGFAAGVFVQNAFLLAGLPDASTPASEAATWLAANQARATAASTVVGLNLPLLLLFVASLRTLARDARPARMWIDLGTLGVVVLVALFGVVAATQIASTILAEGGATAVFTALWSLHNATFALTFTALGTALLGLSIGAHAAGITPAWQRFAGVLGATLLLVAGLANGAVAAGSPILYVGLGGFALWIVWLVATGVRLIRA